MNSYFQVCISLFFILILSFPSYAEKIYSARGSNTNEGVGRYSQFVIAAILKDIGLSFDDKNKQDQPEKEKKNLPEKEKSDFFSDDNFFDDDSDLEDMSFDDTLAEFEDEYKNIIDSWDKEYNETVAKWMKAKKNYNKDKDKYAKTTVNFQSLASSSPPLDSTDSGSNVKTVNLEKEGPGSWHIIPYSLELAVKDQLFRGTCGAFASIRAVESVLNQNRNKNSFLKNIDLSEQHFFWLSRSDCQGAPCVCEKDKSGNCSNDGSMPDLGLRASMQDGADNGLRLERDCPYYSLTNINSITYSPLTSCRKRSAYFHINRMHSRLRADQVVNELAANRPVIAGFKLPTNFISVDKGLLTLEDSLNYAVGGGHAVVLVGYIKLPENYWPKEGKYCAIMTNSWGLGWGLGGHTCLTEKWIDHYAIADRRDPSRKSMMTSIESVKGL
ncbi:C1 family peptidase [uncultured Desulfuromusa sp.]|uniref:C1 family peptidase n=1 Tax=uncultured Desulfuromusa sp. TaxID=219183 RepID=UPI002AA7B08F|nr:C1 family peptidase [uncultured Desulfuromusa sp.]